jgi:hypothetical protein
MTGIEVPRRDVDEANRPRHPDNDVTDRIRAIGDDLHRTLSAVLDAVPGSPHRPQELGRQLGLNRDISGRVLKATSRKDPLEVTHVIPGPESLRTLLRAASRKDVDPDSITAAEDAVGRFERFIRNEAGTRRALDAIISASLPGARKRFELASKQAVFKGMSQLKGIQAEAWLSTTLIAPSSENPLRHDVALLHGALGMQRLRPGVTVKFTYRELVDDDDDDQAEGGADSVLTLGSMRVDQFFVRPPAKLEAHQAGNVMVYTLADDHLGPKAAADMLVVDHHPAVLDRYGAATARRKKGTFVAPDIPVKTLVFDALLHEDAYPGSEADLAIYDMGVEGAAMVNDMSRDIDRMDLHESIEFLGRDLRRFGAVEVPNYVDMLLHICQTYGWDASRFRGYRCSIQYPVVGWQFCMSFDPPPPPDTPEAG